MKRLENEKAPRETWTRSKMVPVRKDKCGKAPVLLTHFEDLYGFRGTDARVYFLSPWEFFMYWEVHKLRPPSDPPQATDKTAWLPGVPHAGADGKSIPGTHYVVREGRHPDLVLFPKAESTLRLRNEYYLIRRNGN